MPKKKAEEKRTAAVVEEEISVVCNRVEEMEAERIEWIREQQTIRPSPRPRASEKVPLSASLYCPYRAPPRAWRVSLTRSYADTSTHASALRFRARLADEETDMELSLV